MKVTFRIPTKEYEYVEIEDNFNPDTTPEQLREQLDDYRGAFFVKDGIPPKDFNKFLDGQLNGEPEKDNTDTHADMSMAQKFVIQEVKKAIKRITK